MQGLYGDVWGMIYLSIWGYIGLYRRCSGLVGFRLWAMDYVGAYKGS